MTAKTLTVAEIVAACEELFPPSLAESWDNIGLLVGDPARPATRVMTCLTLTPRTVTEAIERSAHLVIAHHPAPFGAVQQVRTDSLTGWIIWQLAGQRIAVYSPHTAFDSAARGINQLLAERLALADVRPLCPSKENPELGTGRVGILPQPMPFLEFAQFVKTTLQLKSVQVAGTLKGVVDRVAVACGASGTLLQNVHAAGCQAFVLGETRFHTCVEAEFLGVGLCLLGHYQSERLGVEHLTDLLRDRFPQLEIWASQAEADPIRWL